MFLPSIRQCSVRVNRWNQEAPASSSSASCLPPGRLLRRSGENRLRYSNSRLETSFPKQGRVEEQIRSRINLKLWDRGWSVPWRESTTKGGGLSQNNFKWLDQPQRRDRWVSVSLSEALGWSECQISLELTTLWSCSRGLREIREASFVSASHQTKLDTRSMTRRSA